MALDVYKDWLGIPEGPRPPDHYTLLRLVQFEDEVEKIRKNYKKLNTHVRKYATGQYSNESQDLLNELAKAMLCLTDEERKREYDRSLGRVIDDRDAVTGRRPMTSYLQDEGVITADQVSEVKDYADRTGLTIRDALVQMKLVKPDQAARAFASELGRAYIDLEELSPDGAVLDLTPKALVRRFTCLPLFVVGSKDEGKDPTLMVACVDEPAGTDLEDELRLRYEMPIRPVIATPQAINQAIAKYYAPGMRNEAAAATTSSTKGNTKGAAKTTKAVAVSKPVSQLSPEEKRQRAQMGMIFICWLIIGFGWLDYGVLWYQVYRRFGIPEWYPFVGTTLIGMPIAYVLYMTMVKGK